MTTRRPLWPRMSVALLADRGHLATHLVAVGRPGSLCGLSAAGAVPIPTLPGEPGRVTCERCAYLAAAIPMGWSA